MRGLMNNVAVESISFQPTLFFKDLTNAFASLCGEGKDKIEDSEYVALVESVVKHHTNIDIIFKFSPFGPATEIPELSKNNILVSEIFKNMVTSAAGLKMINEAKDVVRGSVNLKSATVSGIFAKTKTTLHYPVAMLTNKKYTPEEHAAITLHEIGHLFTYFEYITRTITTNQVLSGLSKALDGSDTIEEREAVLTTVKKAMHLTDLDTKTLAKTTNKKVIEIVVISNISKEAESELGSNIYDLTSWESLCDQFSARHGAGRHLVTALDKIYKGSGNISFRNTATYLAIEALKLILIFVGLAGITLILITMDSRTGVLLTYDTPEARFKRVRNQIVENLKDKNLSKEDYSRLTEDLVAIDDVLKYVNDRRQFFGVLWDTVWPNARKARNQELLQQELEALAMSDLFVKSADLRQLAN